MTDIAALEANVDRLEAELQAARNALHDAKASAAGIAIGDIVRAKSKLFRVTDIDTNWEGKPWLKGNPQTVGGWFSEVVRHIGMNWENTKDEK